MRCLTVGGTEEAVPGVGVFYLKTTRNIANSGGCANKMKTGNNFYS